MDGSCSAQAELRGTPEGWPEWALRGSAPQETLAAFLESPLQGKLWLPTVESGAKDQEWGGPTCAGGRAGQA